MTYTQHYAHQVDDLIMFDGNALSESVPGVKVINITVGPVEIQSIAHARVAKAGSDFARKRDCIRRIHILVELPLDRVGQAENVRKLRTWAESDEPKPLSLPAYPEDQIYVTLTDFGEFSQREWWLPIELEFTAWDAYFENVRERTAKVGDDFIISGNGDPIVRIVHDVTDSLTDPEWIFDGKRIKLLGTYTSGVIEIDMNNLTVLHNGVPVKLAITSRFLHVRPGAHRVTGVSGGSVQWRERWK